jgi:hypothetical protein
MDQLNLYFQSGVERVLELLKEEDFIEDQNTLTLKGKIAAQIREIHCLVFANMIYKNQFDNLQLLGGRQEQKKLWTLAIEAGRRPDALPAANILLLPALNDMFDITTTRAMATETHAPATIYVMLFALVFVGAVLAGFSMGASRARSWIHMLAFTATMAITITVIVDMEFPRLGMITVNGFERDAFAMGLPQ